MGGDTSNTEHDPLSTRWKPTGAIAGLIAAALLVATLLLLSSLPSADSPRLAIATHLRTRYEVTLAASYVGVLASVTLPGPYLTKTNPARRPARTT